MWCKRLEEDSFGVATVVAKSAEFHWVTVNRDRTPEIPKRFNVSAYPSLLVLGTDEENVHRFQSYMQADELLAELDEALERYALYRAGKTWDTPTPRADQITDEVPVTTLPAPSDGVPAGIVRLGDDLWVGQLGTLFRLDPESAEIRGQFELPRSVMDLATDGRELYAIESGWTAGKPIHVIDPATGETVRQIVTEANKENRSHGAKGIAFLGEHLLVLEGMHGRVHELDPESGEILRTIQTTERWLTGLDTDGENLISGQREHLLVIDPDSGEVRRKIPVSYPLRSIARRGDRIVVMEQPVFGFDREHQRVQVWPQQTLLHVLDLAGDAK